MRIAGFDLGILAQSLVLISPAQGAPLTGPVRYEVVALTGQNAPGTGGATFDLGAAHGVSTPSVSGSGAVVFGARLRPGDPGVAESTDTGIWATRGWGDLSPRLVVREGDPAPGLEGDAFDDFSVMAIGLYKPAVNRSGAIALIAPTREHGTGAWMAIPDNSLAGYAITPIAVPGQDAPGTNGERFLDVDDVRMNDRGEVLFAARLIPSSLVNTSNDAGLWMSSPIDPSNPAAGRTLSRVMREGDAAPGTGGAMFESVVGAGPSASTTLMSLNGGGDVVFLGRLVADGVTADPDTRFGIWRGDATSITTHLRAGDACPGTSGAVFWAFSNPSLTDTGEIAFRAVLRPGIGDATDSNGCVACATTGGDLRLVARNGDIAMGTGGLRYFMIPNLASSVRVNDRGDIVFTGWALDAAAGIDGMWMRPPGRDDPEVIVKKDDPIPGSGGTRRFDSFDGAGRPPATDAFTLNRRGDIAFLNGAAWHTARLFVRSATRAEIVEIGAPTTTTIDVDADPNGSDARRIAYLVLPQQGVAPPGPAISDRADVAFAAVFTDSTGGVFLAHVPPAIPPTYSPADIDGDGYVNASDFSILAASFGDSAPTNAPADLTGDGSVDIADFALFAREFGARLSP